MPFHKDRYPENWKEISKEIRELANNQCEFCGARNHMPHPETGSTVVLTVAHLDHDTQNNRRENLRALCQRCHLRYDMEHHMESASITRSKKANDHLLRNGQIELGIKEK